ncbi:Ribosome-recycling factor [invertebrate metagenome]|uniref:Ribosome-recycling factor n=1 Tax=invertebrate metagenome TaxID=1711999 RepID=A0A2H9T4U6_9ZZZZ
MGVEMINEIKQNAEERMQRSIESLDVAFAKIRTGRAHPSLLDNIRVSYYGAETPLSQVANVTAEDARTLSVRAWERNLVPVIEKAILKSDLGLNPSTAGEVIRIPLPILTEETRRGFTRQARQEAEHIRQSIRNIRREALVDVKDLEKEKEISEDECHRAGEDIQKITDRFVAAVDKALSTKENDLMDI